LRLIYPVPVRPVREKKHRLPDAAYRGQKNVAFTCCVERRVPLFRDAAVVEALLPTLTEKAERYGCLVGIYCFMPDHLHLILCGQQDWSNAKKVVDEFKAKSGLWLGKHRPSFEWQDGYHDHIIRRGEDWRRQVYYVLNNPVRKGLVLDAFDWPFTGSIGFNLHELVIEAHY
jgi:putative transposase